MRELICLVDKLTPELTGNLFFHRTSSSHTVTSAADLRNFRIVVYSLVGEENVSGIVDVNNISDEQIHLLSPEFIRKRKLSPEPFFFLKKKGLK